LELCLGSVDPEQHCDVLVDIDIGQVVNCYSFFYKIIGSFDMYLFSCQRFYEILTKCLFILPQHFSPYAQTNLGVIPFGCSRDMLHSV